MYKKYVKLGKEAVEIEDHETLEELYNDLYNGGQDNNEYQINIEYIFLQLFYHACKLERKGTILYLYNFYQTMMSDSDKVALRQSFTYGKYLMKNKTLKEWYSKTILVNQKI
jgi:hypothetical protein